MAALTFSAVQGGFESDWFQPNNPFQLDLLFPQSEIENPVHPVATASGLHVKTTTIWNETKR